MVTFTCLFVLVTLGLTGLASLFLALSLFSNEWEYVSYRADAVERLAQAANCTLLWVAERTARVHCDANNETDGEVMYLVPAHGGVTELCTDISDLVRSRMLEDKQESEQCVSYLSKEKVISRDSWLDRMRNLAISCAIVSLILLGCSAPLGILGLYYKQISTIMETGVMYSLAAIFGVFNLVFMRYKRIKSDGFYTSTVLDIGIPEDYMKARHFEVGWPPSIECTGLCLCFIASIFWLLLAKIFRFIILSPTIT